MNTNEELKLFILNLTLTLRCTLKCKLCVADITKYDNIPHFNLDYLKDSIDRCFKVVDYAERFQLSGGEPLIHKDIDKIVDKAMEYKDRFRFLGIFSNGTVVPDEKLLKTIAKYNDTKKFKFYLSHYGKYSTKVDEIVSLLEMYNIPHDVKIYHGENQHFDGWVDYGDYQHFNYTEQQLEEIFNKCGVHKMGGIWSLRFGELHACTRSASGMSLRKIPRNENDFVNLFDDSILLEHQREKLRKIQNMKYITACEYCTGDFGTESKAKRYPAAEQI